MRPAGDGGYIAARVDIPGRDKERSLEVDDWAKQSSSRRKSGLLYGYWSLLLLLLIAIFLPCVVHRALADRPAYPPPLTCSCCCVSHTHLFARAQPQPTPQGSAQPGPRPLTPPPSTSSSSSPPPLDLQPAHATSKTQQKKGQTYLIPILSPQTLVPSPGHIPSGLCISFLVFLASLQSGYSPPTGSPLSLRPGTRRPRPA